MKIELWYDSVAQETDILINEIPVNKNDAYGFLYPVRNYPIQSWIYPNGSWGGIENQITAIARDERAEIVFHGRGCDYEDLKKCLCENGSIELSFVEWDTSSIYNSMFSNLLSTLRKNDEIIRKLASALKLSPDWNADYDIAEAELNRAYHIYEDSDLAKADDVQDKCCCFVHESYFTSYEKLQDLLSLTRSLRMPADAIFCCFSDERVKEDYQYYAGSFRKMSFNYCLEGSEYEKKATEKYILPSVVKQKIEKCRELTKSLCTEYSKIKECTQNDFNALKKNIAALNPEEAERYRNIKQLRDKAEIFCHGMKLVYEYIDILFSVSKEYKEEAFHYECIDRLNENINLYLNAESFSGVN